MDPVAFVGALAVTIAAAALASYVPARRTATIDPIESGVRGSDFAVGELYDCSARAASPLGLVQRHQRVMTGGILLASFLQEVLRSQLRSRRLA
jgi:hypothetical protein